jgi:hypothetical protein
MIKPALAALVAFASLTFASISPAYAQATRTWVSGVGDDANPCSRTAPCKTFAGAISKTAAGGEINTLDPGGYGAVTITKSITIANDGNGTAGVLHSGTSGIIINGAGIVVTLRGLDIFGGSPASTGFNGIRFLQGAALHVENCTIRNSNLNVAGNGWGINFVPASGTSLLFVTDTIISNTGSSTQGGGILVRPTGSGRVSAVLTRVQSNNNTVGIKADASATTAYVNVVVNQSVISSSVQHGLWAVGGPTGADIFVDRTIVAGNGLDGLRAENAAGRVLYGYSTMTNNGTGVNAVNGGQTISSLTNRNRGNFSQGSPTSTLPLD